MPSADRAATSAAAAPGRWYAFPSATATARRCAVLFVLAAAALWTALPLWLQTVPHADNVEQLAWAHSLEWGYIKHPPLPTWLLIGASQLLPPGAALTYALALACVAATLLVLWRCGALLFGRRGALLVLLLSSANYYLMGRGSFLNHNTVMLPFVAGSAWAVLRIAQGCASAAAPAGWPVWLLLGAAQALGLLTKYQMAVVILANLLALLAVGAWRAPRFAAHAALATLATVLPLLPHLRWLQQHDFSSFTYAGQSLLADLGPVERLRHTAGFAAQQVGRFAPAIVAAALAWPLARLAPCQPASAEAPPAVVAPRVQRALLLLALVPVGAVLTMALLGGVAPQNHWGASTTLLLPLLVLSSWPRLRQVAPAAMLVAVLIVHLLAAAWNVIAAQRDPQFHHTFAVRPLAGMALQYWQAHTPGQLAILVGPDWDTGALSLELPGHPDVIASGDRRQAPWIDDARLARCGALVFWRPDRPPQEQVGADFAARLHDPGVLRVTGRNGAVSTLDIGIVAPSGAGC